MMENKYYFMFLYSALFWCTFTPIMFLASEILIEEAILPAYISMKIDCHPKGYEVAIEEINEEYNESGSEVQIEISGTYNANSNIIKIYEVEESTIKHEVCHQEQKENNRAYTCKYPVGVFINELECYIRQNYMNYINASELLEEHSNIVVVQ